jgi:hypothetical protein
MYMYGNHSLRLTMIHDVRATAHADHVEPRALEGAYEPAAFNGREFHAQSVSYAAGRGMVIETAAARSDGGRGSPRSVRISA